MNQMSSIETPCPPPNACPICHAPQAGPVRQVIRAGQVSVCPRCGGWYRIPRPTFEELQAIYDQSYYDSWGMATDQTIATDTKRAIFRPLLHQIAALIQGKQPAEIALLDVGGATGTLGLEAQALGWHVSATEINPYSADILRGHFGTERVFEGELPDCTFPASCFDVITMTDVIEHVLDIDAYLTSARKLLYPDGILVLTTPRIDSPTRILMRKNWLHFKAEHIQYFSARAMRLALNRAGFKRIAIKPNIKRLSMSYLAEQLQIYPHGLLTPVITKLRKILPDTWSKHPLPYLCGEMLVIAQNES